MKVYGARAVPWRDLLAAALREEHGVSPLPVIETTQHGKPFFPDLPGVHFSVSHSRDLTLVALSAKPVGVDVEHVRERKPDLPRYALTDPEYALYEALGADWPAFYALWTRREAWCKYEGLGLAKLWGQTPPETGLAFGGYAGTGWPSEPDWQAAVCGEEKAPEEIIWMEVGPA